MSEQESEQEKAIKDAAQALGRGRLVAFPTETVYGLGADASNEDALKKLYDVKGRPSSHPVIVHLAHAEEAEKWCTNISEAAIVLGQIFWPGPLTLVLRKKKHVLDLVTGGQDTVAIRVPSHPIAQALLQEFGGGIAAPSANRFGRLSPTTAEDVRSEFGDEVAVVLDGGACEIGIESTIVDVSGDRPRILRPGMIQAETLAVVLEELGFVPEGDSGTVPRVPGSTASHYAPNTPVKLVSSADFSAFLEELEHQGTDTAVLAFRAPPVLHRHWITAARFPAHYAHNLYRNLRKLDAVGADLLLVEEPPLDGEWVGIWDRLLRASGSKQAEEECDGS